ncbi:MAG: DUF3467 domain-containing protein [Marinifilaceae bacterium]|jgi:hypothetical protein|nr:DUF3467 domain-containing protein [Marinifilaceae bacterium]
MNTEEELDIEIDPEVAHGVYSNFIVIANTISDFVIDFISIMPGIPKPKVRSRIVLTPDNAKRMLISLQENINNYEEENGEIILEKDNGSEIMISGGRA